MIIGLWQDTVLDSVKVSRLMLIGYFELAVWEKITALAISSLVSSALLAKVISPGYARTACYVVSGDFDENHG